MSTRKPVPEPICPICEYLATGVMPPPRPEALCPEHAATQRAVMDGFLAELRQQVAAAARATAKPAA